MNRVERLGMALRIVFCAGCFASAPQAPALDVSAAPTALVPAAAPTALVPIAASAGASSPGTPLAPSPRPPLMGWSSWSHYHRHVKESDIRAQADALADTLARFGYVYVNVDGGWFSCCDEHGRVKADPEKFPSGMGALGKYIHDKGLKFGVYLHPGVLKEAWDANGTVAGATQRIRDFTDTTHPGNTKPVQQEMSYRIDFSKPGAREFIQSYANLLASWGVDYLKLDFVGTGPHIDNRDEVAAWAAAIQKTGRPIWLELSLNLDFRAAAFWKAHANGWRISNDIEAENHDKAWLHVLKRFELAPRWAPYAGPGGWNDFDSLAIGNAEAMWLDLGERRLMMTLWSVACSPLIVGADLTHLDPTDVAMLTNPELIAIDQAGHVASPIVEGGEQQIWRAANADGSYTVAVFNLGEAPVMVTVSYDQLGFGGSALVHDAWTHGDLGRFDGGFQVSLARHAAELFRIYP